MKVRGGITMKKYASFIIVALFIGGLFLYRYQADCMDFYSIFNNENGFYDEEISYHTDGGLAFSEEKINAIENLPGVEGVYPTVNLRMHNFEENLDDEQLEVYARVDGKEKNLTLPITIQLDEKFYNEAHSLFEVGFYNYAREQYIEKEITNMNDFAIVYGPNRVVHRFKNVESGIYIDKYLYEALGCTAQTQSLEITVPLYVPVKMKQELVHYQTEYDEYGIPLEDVQYDFYAEAQTITDYQIIEYTFEVEAVIDDLGFSVYYPVEMNKKLLEMVDYSKVLLEENELYYRSNCYIVKFEDKLSIKQATKKLKESIDKIVVTHPLYFDRLEK